MSFATIGLALRNNVASPWGLVRYITGLCIERHLLKVRSEKYRHYLKKKAPGPFALRALPYGRARVRGINAADVGRVSRAMFQNAIGA